jgi:hypothetical protein
LSASASYAFDPGAAEAFLSPALRKTWRPVQVTVVKLPGKETTLPYHSGVGSPDIAQNYKSVDFTVQHLATLSQGGQYEYSAGKATYTFSLARQHGVWLITGLPQNGHSLLLTQASFQAVYQARNLFFFAAHQPSLVNEELIPDPVYAPVQSADSALNTNVAKGLVQGLLHDSGSWLSPATITAFPPKTKLLNVSISGQLAVVNLGGAAAGASEQAKTEMHAQLLTTLASQAYSSPLARDVLLEINGKPWYPGVNSNLVSPVSTGPLVYQSGPGAISELYPTAPLGQVGPAQVTAVAASGSGAGPAGAAAASGSGSAAPSAAASAQTVAVAVRSGRGCTVYVSAPPPVGETGEPSYRGYLVTTSAGACTSLSWDRNGNLWAVAGGHIWLRWAQTGKWLSVRSPANLPPDGKSGRYVLSLQMAPDGVRAALLVKTPGPEGSRVMLAAVVRQGRRGDEVSLGPAVPVGTGLSDPRALSWYNAYDLVVLTSTGISEVPLTGGSGRLLGIAPAGAESLTSDGATLVVGTAKGAVEVSNNGASSWIPVVFPPQRPFPAYPRFPVYPS